MPNLNIYPFSTKKPGRKSLFFIAGPCVIESEGLCLGIAETLAAAAAKENAVIIFKASYDKANRTSRSSFRGLGMKRGLKILEKVKLKTGLPVLTDIHSPQQAAEAADVADILQIPAFLCRQTDLLVAAAKTGKFVNVKKGQFMAPADMKYSLEKAGRKAWITERGTVFGYNRLVVDFAGIPVLKRLGAPVIFDATHSVQTPGGGRGRSSGNRDLALPLARAAVCMGVDGLFFEIHPNPEKALCDKDNTISVKEFVKNIPRLGDLFDEVSSWK
ncbi:MAG TPA: 3-deoxy-8-phosphooctulonate synthase [Chitinivibrionales bacterium]|nr:3-deoxy-8-phosphooctulonate synthase [Chitinivibrionales bacterium]